MTTALMERPLLPRAKRAFSFARHDTFHIRDGWLAKGIHAIAQEPEALYGPDSHHELGVGVNMIKSIRYWIEATGLARPRNDLRTNKESAIAYELTSIGQSILTHDPYLEDMATLWLVHGQLVSNQPLATSWHWIFNVMPPNDFSIESIGRGLASYAEQSLAVAPTPNSIRKDILCIIRTYTREIQGRKGSADHDPLGCPLAALGLMAATGGGGRFKLVIGQHPTIPVQVFLYFLYRFVRLGNRDSRIASFEDVRWAPLSPGRLLCLDGEAIRDLIGASEAAYGRDSAREIKTAGLDQILISDREPEKFIQDYYGARDG